jgi:hypothetical protein
LWKILYLQWMWHFEKKMQTVWESMMNWWRDKTARKHVHTGFTVARPDFCATKFITVWKSSNRCTNSQTTPHTIKLFAHAQQPVLRTLSVYGAPKVVLIANRISCDKVRELPCHDLRQRNFAWICVVVDCLSCTFPSLLLADTVNLWSDNIFQAWNVWLNKWQAYLWALYLVIVVTISVEYQRPLFKSYIKRFFL